MSTTYTSNLGMGVPSTGDRSWGPVIAADLALLDSSVLGALCVSLTEVPSTTPRVSVSAGSFQSSGRAAVSYAGASPVTLTASSTNYLYLTDAGVLTRSTSGFPSAGNYLPLAVVTTSGTAVTALADARMPWMSRGGHGGLAIGTPTIAAGTGAGTSPTVAVSGSDQAGTISLTTGTSPSPSAAAATVTFGQAFAATPRSVLLTPANAAAAGVGAMVYIDAGTLSTTLFNLGVGSSALAASTAYQWYFLVMG